MKIVPVISRIIQGLSENTYLKTMVGLVFSLAAFLFDPATKMALISLVGLILADFLTSIVAIRKTGTNKRGNPLASSSAMGSAVKTAVYFTIIAAGFMTERAVPLPFIDDTIIGFLALTELISILENAGRAGYAIPRKLLDLLIKMKDDK